MAAGDAFVIEDTGSETNRSHTTEADRGLSGSPVLEQGDFSGQWTSPDLTIPNTSPILAGYSDFLRSSGTSRSGSVCQFRVDTTNQGMIGATSWGYNRVSGGADESSRHGVFLDHLTANDELQIREATVLNGSDRVGDYDRSSGDPRGFWAVELPDNDYLYASLSVSEETGAGRYGNSPRPIDLGTPSALSEGSFAAINSFNTDASSGTTITRSGGDFTVAANSKVLCVATFQFDSSTTDRNSGLIRMDKDGSPYAWISVYIRDGSSDLMTGCIAIPVITGGSSEVIDFSFVEQVEETVPEVNLEDANVRFFDLTDADMCLLGKTDADVTNITGTAQQVSYPTADEILVDSASFDHPSGNLTRITNNAGATITVLCGFHVMCDSSSAASGTRKTPGSQLRRNGTQLDYMCASEYARGAQSADDQFTAGYSFCAPVELTSGQYLEHDIYDFAGNAAVNLIVNASDDAAIYFWAIRLDDFGGGTVDMSGTATITVTPDADLIGYQRLGGTDTITVTPDADLIGFQRLGGTDTATVTPQADLSLAVSMSGTSTITVTPQGDLVGNQRMGGTGTATVTPQAGLALTSGISGADTVTVTPQAGLALTSSVSSSDTITVTPQAGLTLAVGLSGTNTVTVTPQADLVGFQRLGGTSTATVTPQADLGLLSSMSATDTITITPQAAAGLLASVGGSTTITVTPQGDAELVVSMSGTDTVTVTPQANLVGYQHLAGTGAAAVTTQGGLSLTSSISGTDTVTVTPSGDLVGFQRLGGSDTITVTPDGDLAVSTQLSGTGTVTITPQGGIALLSSVSAGVTLTVTPQAALSLLSSMSGTGLATLTPNGDLVGFSRMSSTGTLTLTPQANLKGYVGLGATGTVTVTPQADMGLLSGVSGTVTITITPSGDLQFLLDLSDALDVPLTMYRTQLLTLSRETGPLTIDRTQAIAIDNLTALAVDRATTLRMKPL